MHHPDLTQLRQYVGAPGKVGITTDSLVWTDRISGKTFATEIEALESARLSYVKAGGQRASRLTDLQNLYAPEKARAKVEAEHKRIEELRAAALDKHNAKRDALNASYGR